MARGHCGYSDAVEKNNVNLSGLEKVSEEVKNILLKLLLSEDWELISFEEAHGTLSGTLRLFFVKSCRGHVIVRTPDSYRMLSVKVDLGSGNYSLRRNSKMFLVSRGDIMVLPGLEKIPEKAKELLLELLLSNEYELLPESPIIQGSILQFHFGHRDSVKWGWGQRLYHRSFLVTVDLDNGNTILQHYNTTI